ncbi:MAG: putative Ig domain-containing protein, partial [Verrucomicrobiae bacterium]|nr:putative Ig domain-containing protein [Verrucomicrobiae bacterium]
FGVRDSSGEEDTAVALVQILNINRPPSFPTPPAHQLLAGQLFTLDIAAVDPDGNDLTYSVADLPPGATFDGDTGTFTWTPVGAQAGRYDIPVTASDGLSKKTELLTLVVTTEAVPPSVRIDLTPSFPVNPARGIVIQVTASGIAPIASLGLKVDGKAVSLDMFGRAVYITKTPGILVVEASVTDEDGITGTAISEILVRDPGDLAAPVVNLDAPGNGMVISSLTDVQGSVSDQNLNFWQLSLTAVGSSAGVVLNSGRVNATDMLGSIDPGRFENGAYTLVLEARDISGRVTKVERLIEINSDSKPGAYTRLETDFTIEIDGLVIPISRFYSSLNANQDADFGYGWQFALADPGFASNLAPTGREVDGLYNAYSRGTRVYLTLPNGTRAGFTFDPMVIESGNREFYQPFWKSDSGVTFTLLSGSAVLREVEGEFFEVGTGLPYNPFSGQFDNFDFAVSSAEGTRYVYSVTAGLREIWTASGEKVNWTQSGVIAADGSRVAVERNSQGRISRIVAPDGTQAIYQYDGFGNLVQATILEDNQRTWLGYRATRDHLLTDIA